MVIYNQTLQNFFNDTLAFYMPPPKLSLSEWSDEYAYLSAESSHEPGKWKTIPYQVGIMDAYTDPTVERITFMKSARVGYTKILNNIIGYNMHQDPKSMLMVQPTVEDAQGYSKEELAPMLRDTPCLDGLVADVKSRDSNNTILKKCYPGGFLTLTGANSARGFRRISVPVVLFDETDGYPATAGQEGDQIKLGTMRTQYFWNRKIVLGSTPTVKGVSRIEDSFEQSDKRFYYVPCPFCGEMQILRWGGKDTDFGVKWPDGKPEDAYYLCRKCHEKIKHSKKRSMVTNGEWVATEGFKGHAGFHIWAAYSFAPNAAWGELAIEFLDSKSNAEKLKTFINTILGETFEEKGDQPEWSKLKARCEPYEPLTVPKRGLFLSAGVDVQDNRLAVKIKAWGRGEESFLIYWTEIYGDPNEQTVWNQLDTFLNRSYQHESGAALNILSCGVDTGGHRTQAVYNYCRQRSPIVFALKGANQANKPVIGKPTQQDVNYLGTKIENGVQLWPIGTDTAKKTIYSRLKMTEQGPGYCHFYIGITDEYFNQLTAEKLITRHKKGFPVQEWVKVNDRNEALDCEVYAYAAAIRAGMPFINWNDLEKNLKGVPKSNNAETHQPQQGVSGWVNGSNSQGGSKWLRR